MPPFDIVVAAAGPSRLPFSFDRCVSSFVFKSVDRDAHYLLDCAVMYFPFLLVTKLLLCRIVMLVGLMRRTLTYIAMQWWWA